MSVRPCLAENVCRCSFAFFAPSFPSSPAVCGADSRAAYTVSSLVAVWHHSQLTNDVPGRNPCRGGVLRFAVCCTCRVTGCGDCPVAERTVLYCTVLYCTVLYCTVLYIMTRRKIHIICYVIFHLFYLFYLINKLSNILTMFWNPSMRPSLSQNVSLTLVRLQWTPIIYLLMFGIFFWRSENTFFR